MARPHGSFVAAVLFAAVACSGEPDGSAPRDRQQPVDSGVSDGGEGKPDGASSATGVGVIIVTTPAGAETSAFAVFMTPGPSGGALPQADGCTVLRDGEGGGVYGNTGAGPIVVAAGSRSAELEDQLDADGKSTGYPMQPLSGGTSPLALDVPIRVGAGGAIVPAFELTVMPADIPEFTTSPAGFVVVGQPFEVSWAPKAADHVWVQLERRGEGGVTVNCHVEATKGKVVLSSDRIAALTTDPSTPLRLTVRGQRRKDARIGDFAVTRVHHGAAMTVSLPVL
ncbi:MAG: hypothetical protein KF901_34050 [Myxococcales bacterium]|nr:hypothetical protein [Myxococcales bacterium]